MSVVDDIRAEARATAKRQQQLAYQQKRKGGVASPRLTVSEQRRMRELRGQGYLLLEIAHMTGRGINTVRRALGLAAGIALMLAASPAMADDAPRILSGTAIAVDGDTLKIGTWRVRLKGVAAPEMREAGGTTAKAYLEGLTYGVIVSCELTGEKTWNREVGFCSIGDTDVGETIIRAGYARSCPRYSDRYVGLEDKRHAALPLPPYCEKRR